MSTMIRLLAVIGLVAAATAVGLVADAGTAPAALLMLLTVVLGALRGRATGILAAVAGFLSLNFFFTPPIRRLGIAKRDDNLALAAFLVVALAVDWLVALLADLRRKAEQREHEAAVLLDLTQRLLAGEDSEAVVGAAAQALVRLFGFTSCSLTLAGRRGQAGRGSVPGREWGRSAPEVRLLTGRGELVAVPAEGRPLSGDDRAVLEALVSALGTALERVELEGEAREARLAAAVGRTRSSFLSAVSHNLRTPLASIKAATSTLLAPDAALAATDSNELLETIYAETDRLERLVTKVLDLSRIRAGGLEFHPEPVDFAGLAAAAIRRVRPLARDHRLSLQLPDDLSVLYMDVAMMEQVLLNLLENALRFAPPGSEIRIEGRRAGSDVEVRVVDSGPGIPQADRERIFEEFVRGDSSDAGSGTGLGLAIVRALVEAHGGRVWCEETPGGGATVALAVSSGLTPGAPAMPQAGPTV